MNAIPNGYPDVGYDPAIWIAVPIWFGDGTLWPDHRVWARAMAQDCWTDCADTPGEYEVDNLALQLTLCAERFGPDLERPDDPFSQAFLHLPHPRGQAVPVTVWIDGLAGELDEYVLADDPEAVGGVETVEFDVPKLSRGLRAFRLREVPADEADAPGEQYAVLRYAWQLAEEKATIVITCSAEPDTVLTLVPEIDDLARTITWVPD